MSTQAVPEFRPSSVHQHAERKGIKPSARELWPTVRARLAQSRKVLEAARTIEYPTTRRVLKVDKKTGEKTWTRVPAVQRVHRPPVFDAPTFRNVIEDGVLR